MKAERKGGDQKENQQDEEVMKQIRTRPEEAFPHTNKKKMCEAKKAALLGSGTAWPSRRSYFRLHG
jgi:lipid A disaccharide synthetase